MNSKLFAGYLETYVPGVWPWHSCKCKQLLPTFFEGNSE